jgi:hypothetical protein
MALRAGHGAGAGVPRVEVLPPDELPAGMPVDARPGGPADRGDAGRFAHGNTMARAGGRAKRGKSRLTSRLGLADVPRGVGRASGRRWGGCRALRGAGLFDDPNALQAKERRDCRVLEAGESNRRPIEGCCLCPPHGGCDGGGRGKGGEFTAAA